MLERFKSDEASAEERVRRKLAEQQKKSDLRFCGRFRGAKLVSASHWSKRNTSKAAFKQRLKGLFAAGRGVQSNSRNVKELAKTAQEKVTTYESGVESQSNAE